MYTCDEDFKNFRTTALDGLETCPSYYFNPNVSPSLQCTSEIKTIVYGSGSAQGTICTDEIKVTPTTDFLVEKMPFLEEKMPYDAG